MRYDWSSTTIRSDSDKINWRARKSVWCSISAHVQSIGWQAWVKNGATSGTEG
ncbi:hypothetical protein [Pseudolactococcus yaeyamensis]